MAAAHTYASWFNAAALAVPGVTQTTETTERPGAIRGPGFWRTDLSLFKNMKFNEHLTGQLRWETFNTFNHAQFNNPNLAVSSANTFGQISSTSVNPRIVQLALKYSF